MPKGDNLRGKKPTNTPKGPSNYDEVERRVTQVYQLLVLQYTNRQIKAAIGEKYKVSDTQVDRYIAKAKEWMREEEVDTREEMKKKVGRKIRVLQQSASKDKKRGDVARAIKLEMELHGLQEPKQIEITKGSTLNMADLEKFGGDDGLTEEQKKIAQNMTLLSE